MDAGGLARRNPLAFTSDKRSILVHAISSAPSRWIRVTASAGPETVILSASTHLDRRAARNGVKADGITRRQPSQSACPQALPRRAL